MTLDEELLGKGFTACGPVLPNRVGEVLQSLFDKSSPMVYVQILPIKFVRGNISSFSDCYMFYYITKEDLKKYPELSSEYCLTGLAFDEEFTKNLNLKNPVTFFRA